ncbi:MAG: AMP-binding protein [Pararhodobacter sp.]
MDAVQPGDLAFLVYTSGTTPAPKGAMIWNAHAVFQMSKAGECLDAKPGGKSLSFLPLRHSAARIASGCNALAFGLAGYFPENAGTVPGDLREVAPHVVFAPPRVWEKMHSQIEQFLRDAPARWVCRRTLASVPADVAARLEGRQPPRVGTAGIGLKWLAFGSIRVVLGLRSEPAIDEHGRHQGKDPGPAMFTAVNTTRPQPIHSCEHQAARRRPVKAMIIGPQENAPAAAFAVRARK